MKNNPRPRITTIAYHLALWPVVLGVAIVLVWYLERLSWLPIAGVMLMYVVPFNFIVIVFLIVRWVKNNKLPREDRLSSKFFSIPLLALSMNYVVGFLCLVAGSYIGNLADILIVNNSSFRLVAVQAQDPSGTRTVFPDIESNDKASLSFYLRGEGAATVRFTADSKEIVTTPIEYVTWGESNVVTVVIDEKLVPRIQRKTL